MGHLTLKPGWLRKEVESCREACLARALATVAPAAVIARATPEEMAKAERQLAYERADTENFLRHD